jgi:hypothetical protein
MKHETSWKVKIEKNDLKNNGAERLPATTWVVLHKMYCKVYDHHQYNVYRTYVFF